MSRHVAILALGLGLGLQACDGQPGSTPVPPDGKPPVTSETSPDAQVRLEYVCGNRFIIINTKRFAVTARYRVQGTSEEGERSLKPAPVGDPPFSETEIVTTKTGPVELIVDQQPVQVMANEGAPCAEAGERPAFALTGSVAEVGEWSAPFTWPIVPVHMSLLRNGRVLAWGKFGDPYIWDPAKKTFTVKPAPSWVFCAGHAFLPDGRLLVAGGHISDDHGLPDANLFEVSDQSWNVAPPMQYGRWYPTATVLANGEVVVLAGRDQAGLTVTIPEVWTGSGWRALTSASRSLPYYPRTFLAPDGRIFYAGEQRTTRYLSTSGTGKWTTVGDRLFGTRDYGAAVMYEPGKILYVGGGRTTNTAEIIDLNQASPAWQWTGSMAIRRRHHNATMLPTGEVLVTGGVSGRGFNDVNTGVRSAEVWNPTTGNWTTLASNAVTRAYHGTSLLLPDGRVLHAGSGDALFEDGTPAPAERNGELFSPPYLFKGPRPTITSVTGVWGYSKTISIPTPSAVAKVSLIAIGSTTHAFDMNQRFMWLTFTPTSTGIDVRTPTNPNLAPPGYYMVFLLNADGVPSVGKVIKLR